MVTCALNPSDTRLPTWAEITTSPPPTSLVKAPLHIYWQVVSGPWKQGDASPLSSLLVEGEKYGEWSKLTMNVPVVFMARYVMVLRVATSLRGALEGVGPKKSKYFFPTLTYITKCISSEHLRNQQRRIKYIILSPVHKTPLTNYNGSPLNNRNVD